MALLMTKHLRTLSDGKVRCWWVGAKPHFITYHDHEWGVPVHKDRKHFEMLLLEGAQAGLTWETILLRREGYRRAFAQFDPQRVARFTAKKKALLLKNSGIIRNRLKIDSAVTNAQAFPEGVRFIRSLRLAVRRRKTESESPDRQVTGSCHEPRERHAFEGSKKARLPLRGQHDRLCLHAGDWDGE
jgi:DNA-3-methyladenine glycosylase I